VPVLIALVHVSLALLRKVYGGQVATPAVHCGEAVLSSEASKSSCG